jgi:ADP-ribose pyrophosphatase
MNGPDSIRTVYDGKLVKLAVERWGERDIEVVEHPGSVAIVAIDREERLTLVRQFRHVAHAELLELPAGKLDPGEEPLEAAQREVAEECGLRGGDWRLLGRVWSSPGFLREELHLFLAEGLEQGEPDHDEHEEIELVRWPVAEVESRLGELADAKTFAGLALYLRARR